MSGGVNCTKNTFLSFSIDIIQKKIRSFKIGTIKTCRPKDYETASLQGLSRQGIEAGLSAWSLAIKVIVKGFCEKVRG